MKLNYTKVLFLDDDPLALEQSRIAAANYVQLENITCTTSAVEAMNIIEAQKVNLVFLDVEMTETNGFAVAAFIDSKKINVKYVFLTGHAEFAADSYEYKPIDFLTKPIDIVRMSKTFERYEASTTGENHSQKRIAIDTNSGFELIAVASVNYIAKENRRTIIYCTDKKYKVAYSLDEMEIIFKNFGILRVHQSFLVPIGRISSIMPDDFGKTYWIRLENGIKVPVSQKKYPQLREILREKGILFL